MEEIFNKIHNEYLREYVSSYLLGHSYKEKQLNDELLNIIVDIVNTSYKFGYNNAVIESNEC